MTLSAMKYLPPVFPFSVIAWIDGPVKRVEHADSNGFKQEVAALLGSRPMQYEFRVWSRTSEQAAQMACSKRDELIRNGKLPFYRLQ